MESYYETDNFKYENENLRWKRVQGNSTPPGPPGLWLNEPPGANLVRSHLAAEDRQLSKRQGSSPHRLRIILWGLVAGSLQQGKIPSHKAKACQNTSPRQIIGNLSIPYRLVAGSQQWAFTKRGLRPYQPQKSPAIGTQYPCAIATFLVFKCLEKPMLNEAFRPMTEKHSGKRDTVRALQTLHNTVMI